MKAIVYAARSAGALRTYRKDAERIMARIERYAELGAGDVRTLVGRPGKRLQVGDFRVLFEEGDTTITVLDIGPRGGIYD